jgi:tryptophan synthase alpha subunit
MGLTVPVVFMGYYNPVLSYGEERLMQDCKEAGVNGFIIIDLPPEEALTFRNFCCKAGSVSEFNCILLIPCTYADVHIQALLHPAHCPIHN